MVGTGLQAALWRKDSVRILALDVIWQYTKTLRRCEYLRNCNKLPRLAMNPMYLLAKLKLRRLSFKLGFSISENCFGPGLSIAHYGNIVVNPNVRVGENCRIHVGVNIGSGARGEGCPKIGNNVYIGPGAKIFGDIVIGDNTVIGANAVVNKSFPEGNMTIGGIPARKLSDKTSEGIIKQ